MTSGYFKQSRSIGGAAQPADFIVRYGQNPSTRWSGNVIIPGDQTTTSFRTRGGSESERVEVDETSLVPFPTGDTGHPFDTTKRTVKGKTRFVSIGLAEGTQYSSGYGPALLSTESAAAGYVERNFPIVNPLSQDMVNNYGSRLILSATPTSPNANLLLTLSEVLKEGLPSIPGLITYQNRAFSARKTASENLNFQFGVKPLLNDLNKILVSVRDAPSILAQLRADSGKVIRRRREITIPDTFSERVITESDRVGGTFIGRTTDGQYLPLDLLHLGPVRGPMTETLRTTQRVWFSGAFQYHLEIGDSVLAELTRFEQEANKLLGLRLTPELLWELSPWSWLADWFANIGPILGNVSNFAADGLTLQHGYLMRHTVANRYLSIRPKGNQRNVGKEIITRYRTERKERFRASPFGFGFRKADMDLRKTGILASLAVAKAPGRRDLSFTPIW